MAEVALRTPRSNVSYRAGIILLSCLLVPPLLLVEAWKTRSERYRHWLLTLFFTVYGATIAIAFDPLGRGPDGVRHLLSVYTHYVGLGIDEYLIQLWEILTFQLTDSPKEDVYIHTLSYFVGGILGMPWLFFPIVATVYGYFFTGSMLIIFRDWGKLKLPLVTLFLIATFFFLKNIEGVNTVRTWTALWVLVYGALRYHGTKKKKYLLIMALPPFVHFGYFLLALPAYAVVLFGNRILLYSAVFVASSFTTFINPGQFEEIAATTELSEQRFDAYYRESEAAAGAIATDSLESGQRLWKAFARAGVQKWGLNIFVYTLLIAGVYRYSMSRFQKSLFSTGLLTLALSNSVWFIYAASNRGWIIGAVFVLLAFVMSRLKPDTAARWPFHRFDLKAGLLLSAFALTPYFLYNLSTFLDYPSMYLLGLPIIVWIDPALNISIKEFLQVVLIEMLNIL